MWMHNSIFIPLARNVDSYLEMRVHLADSTRWLGIDFDSVSSLVERTLTVRFIREQNSTKRKQNKNEKNNERSTLSTLEINIHQVSENKLRERAGKKSHRTRFKVPELVESRFTFLPTFIAFLACLIVCERRMRWQTPWIRIKFGEWEREKSTKHTSWKTHLEMARTLIMIKKDGSTQPHHWITNKFSTSKDNRS